VISEKQFQGTLRFSSVRGVASFDSYNEQGVQNSAVLDQSIDSIHVGNRRQIPWCQEWRATAEEALKERRGLRESIERYVAPFDLLMSSFRPRNIKLNFKSCQILM
jgi:hypothetical protein